ncbi:MULTISPECIES: RNA-guided endonuclease InsQ/TnpB family protein [Calothrix]|uniref:IS200/IS605 family element transposase accessory protein TnpB n=2 Tax=Calothrix TaxID=1186 RepID=A0ABR8AAR9_9CYAN|nr:MULTISPECIES: RNA-guided endonuclease TnpB family protein [Calothrix]MBD2196949.1 IS200/IS605 family element transposase accessory protein TnpB [Calothrix parietina FACHB-288]MBD2225501.1 IS200/IS605 family element transposase accessory protein TnpB [Calothrix anomala FACHB-343]
MQLVEKHIINRQHKFWKECDYLALQSKHLYNAANYVQRQYFFETSKYYNSIDIYHQTKNLEAYRYLPTKVSKQIVRRLSEAWKGWLAALKDWSKHPEKYLGKPKMPGYKHKKRGRNIVIYPIDAISKPALTKRIIKLSQTHIEFPTQAKNVDQVRIVPKIDHYVIEVIYTVADAMKSSGKYSAGIDLGLNNLMAVTSNHPAIRSLLINGRPLKSINQFFNKRVAKAQSIAATRQVKKLNSKRDRRIDNYLHTVSRRIIDWCQLNAIGQLIIGNNLRWKQDINIGKKNNQDFTKIPHAKLISLLTYKAQLAGIEVVLTEESYTSKASALDGDELPVYHSKTNHQPVFSGQRIQRGLYKTHTGKFINADTNGSLNIARKVIPNFMDGIEGLPFIPVVLGLWTKITNIVV